MAQALAFALIAKKTILGGHESDGDAYPNYDRLIAASIWVTVYRHTQNTVHRENKMNMQNAERAMSSML